MEGGTFGAAVDAKDNAWFTNYGSKSIAVFDKNGKPLTPPEGITFDGKLGLMQGIIVTPSGDVWVLGIEKSQLVHFPKGDLTKGRIVCEGDKEEPCKSFRAPFHLGIDQQDRIWVSNSGVDHVTRFPAADPSKAENFKTGINNSGLAIDSQGNVWVTNRFGNGLLGMAHLIDMGVRLKLEGVTAASDYLTKTMSEQKGGATVAASRCCGRTAPHFPARRSRAVVFPGRGLWSWTAMTTSGSPTSPCPSSPIVQLCGVRTENCPPGMKTGDQISPPGGYVGGGLQMQTDIAIDPAGNVWVMNNWQDIDSCIGTPNEALSTRCGGQGVVSLLRHGQAGARTADRTGASAIANRRISTLEKSRHFFLGSFAPGAVWRQLHSRSEMFRRINRSAQHLLILRGEEVCHGDITDLVHGSAEGRAVGAMEKRAKCCGHLAGAGKEEQDRR